MELTEAGQDGAVFAKKTSRSSNPGGLDAFENLKQFFLWIGNLPIVCGVHACGVHLSRGGWGSVCKELHPVLLQVGGLKFTAGAAGTSMQPLVIAAPASTAALCRLSNRQPASSPAPAFLCEIVLQYWFQGPERTTHITLSSC